MIMDSAVQYYDYGTDKMAYADTGNGDQVLVFLHGMGSSQKAWAKNVSELKDTFRCITLDLPGYGLSSPLPSVYEIGSVAELVIDFISTLQLRNVSLVGHSMGGHISMEIARRAPKLVDRLVLVAPAGLERFEEKEIAVIEQFFTAELVSSYPDEMIRKNFLINFYRMPEDAKFMIEDRLQLKADKLKYLQFCKTIAETTQAIVKYNMLEYLDQLRLPVLIMYGRQDKLIPHHILHPELELEAIVGEALEKLEKGSLVLYENCGHFVQWEKAEEVNAEILGFCGES